MGEFYYSKIVFLPLLLWEIFLGYSCFGENYSTIAVENPGGWVVFSTQIKKIELIDTRTSVFQRITGNLVMDGSPGFTGLRILDRPCNTANQLLTKISPHCRVYKSSIAFLFFLGIYWCFRKISIKLLRGIRWTGGFACRKFLPCPVCG